MPNSMLKWNEIALVGNHTKSAIINKLIRQVKKKEAARLGVASQARRAFLTSEYESAMQLMDSINDEETRTTAHLSDWERGWNFISATT